VGSALASSRMAAVLLPVLAIPARAECESASTQRSTGSVANLEDGSRLSVRDVNWLRGGRRSRFEAHHNEAVRFGLPGLFKALLWIPDINFIELSELWTTGNIVISAITCDCSRLVHFQIGPNQLGVLCPNKQRSHHIAIRKNQ
jgi:hypothetical protein